MGEYADMLLDGTCDEETGEYIGPPVGYPRSNCKDSRKADYKLFKKPHECKFCNKKFYSHHARTQHVYDKHIVPYLESIKDQEPTKEQISTLKQFIYQMSKANKK